MVEKFGNANLQYTANFIYYCKKNAVYFIFLEKVLYICSVIHFFSAYDRTYRVYVSSGEMER